MVTRILFRLAAVAVLLVFLTPNFSLSTQERRIALVIGNGSYKKAPLANPVNDALDMTDALERCDFTVMKVLNANRKKMRWAIRKFGEEINKGAVGLFYYAGHGIQVDGENYLIPIGTEVYNEDEVKDECLMVSSVLRKMESAGNRLNIIILDACRDNPFGRSFRSSNRGLAKMDAPTGSILAYSTAPGSVAADGTDRNGLYTSKLLKHIMTPGLEIGKLFRQVRIDVIKDSGERQVPWESSSLTGDFYFNSKRGIAVVEPPSTEPTPKYASISPEVSKPKVIARDGHFIKYATSVVYDTKKGIEWFAGPDRNTTWHDAKLWADNLAVDSGVWRMPTITELQTLCKKRFGSSGITSLMVTTGWLVWSGEIFGSSAAWVVHSNFCKSYCVPVKVLATYEVLQCVTES